MRVSYNFGEYSGCILFSRVDDRIIISDKANAYSNWELELTISTDYKELSENFNTLIECICTILSEGNALPEEGNVFKIKTMDYLRIGPKRINLSSSKVHEILSFLRSCRKLQNDEF